MKGDGSCVVVMDGVKAFVVDKNMNAEFFMNFPFQGLIQGFAVVYLSAGEFPESAEMNMIGPLGDQDTAITFNDGGNDGDHGWLRCR